jgi:hypothetical protein
MTIENLTIRSAEFEGHIATLRCRLGPDHGWDVCAELDNTVVRKRHCSDWRAVERMEIWLLSKLCESPVLT